MIEAFVRAAIETTSDEAAKPRLRRCVPPLLVAIKNWAGSPAGEVVMAAATPKSAFMFVADDWPDIDEGEFQTHEVARALVGAIESSASGVTQKRQTSTLSGRTTRASRAGDRTG